MAKLIPTKQITSWSFSRYLDYKLCPLKAKLKHVDKIKEPGNAAMDRGAAIHNLCEDYIKGKISRLPPELKLFKDEFAKLRKVFKKVSESMVVEDNWAFTKDWTETAWNDWVGCWVRIKLDCAHHEEGDVMVVTDWKTGKFNSQYNEDYIEQLELYALSALILHPHLRAVKPRLAYVDHGIVFPEPGSKDEDAMTFVQSDVPKLKKTWATRTKAMMNDKKFAPRPNNKCQWCFYRSANKAAGGGQCKF